MCIPSPGTVPYSSRMERDPLWPNQYLNKSIFSRKGREQPGPDFLGDWVSWVRRYQKPMLRAAA